LQTGVSTSLRPFFALSAAIALNTQLRVCLTVATPFDRMASKVKSWLSHVISDVPTIDAESFPVESKMKFFILNLKINVPVDATSLTLGAQRIPTRCIQQPYRVVPRPYRLG